MPLKQFAAQLTDNSPDPAVHTPRQEPETVSIETKTEPPAKHTNAAAIDLAHPSMETGARSTLSSDAQQLMCALSAMQIRYGRAAEAVPYLMMVRRRNPENIECIRLLALAFMRLERWEEADIIVAELEALQSATPNGNDAMTIFYRSIVAFKNRRTAEAKDLFAKFRAFMQGAKRGVTS